MRALLAIAAVVVLVLVGLLVVKARPGAESTQATGAATASPSVASQQGKRASAAPAVPAGPPDASPLPTPEEVTEARERVESEHVRSPSHAPELLDNNIKAKPMKDARKAFARGDYDVALERAEDALAVEPDASVARVLAALSACGMGERAIAQAHADKLDDMRKARVARRCDKFGIAIKGAKDIPDDL